ncbi:MAG: RNA polymerase sigma-70 factor [Bacteroidales bacterium]
MNDILVIKLLQNRDKQALKYIFDTYFESLCRFMFVYLKDEKDAEEIALDIFMYLWENSERIDIKISLKAYLFQAAKNRCLNAIRDKKATLAIDNIQEYEYLQADISSTLEIEDLNRLIEEAILSLPDKCQEVFVKSRKEYLSNQEIADSMDISVKTVEAQITKALKRIRETLGEQYYYLF